MEDKKVILLPLEATLKGEGEETEIDREKVVSLNNKIIEGMKCKNILRVCHKTGH